MKLINKNYAPPKIKVMARRTIQFNLKQENGNANSSMLFSNDTVYTSFVLKKNVNYYFAAWTRFIIATG